MGEKNSFVHFIWTNIWLVLQKFIPAKHMTLEHHLYNVIRAGKIAEKAMWRSVFLTIWHRILNADLTKTPSSSVTFLAILPAGMYSLSRSFSYVPPLGVQDNGRRLDLDIH